ncbi:DUF354 domain-containing protein [Halorarum salinum]|uniref:DUF354 domain-containing protein n=1 Tax=Halorarum salinum TaxID=2743089 RepID=A0A7D5LDV6_9EURY|nr:DUF354 domain-containing protein [Halobaculum salinum]QLG64330.1 DUF354 domain-containing protein [Halobaculum salinum]
MRALFDVSHPAHVHLFKHAAAELGGEGHDVFVASREKDVTTDLLDAAGIAHSPLTGVCDGRYGTAREWVAREGRLLRLVRRFDPDVVVSRLNPAAAHVSRLLGVPNVVFHDSEFAGLLERVTTPFATVVCTPAGFGRDFGERQRRYEGFHELAYLHPARFEPDPDALREAGVDPDEPYAVLRFVAMGAHHDVGHESLSPADKRELVERLEEEAGLTVYVSSEGPLPADLDDRRVPVPPEAVHQLLAHADVYAGDSGTMATEAAVLATPTARFNPYGDEMGNFHELHEYGLVRTLHGVSDFVDAAVALATDPDAGDRWRTRRRDMLAEKVDVTAYMLETVREVAAA